MLEAIQSKDPSLMEAIDDVSITCKVLSNRLRLEIYEILLEESPFCVTELVQKTGRGQPEVSAALRLLRQRNLVKFERRGQKNLYYALRGNTEK